MNRIKYIGSTFLRMLSLLIAVSILSFILVTSSPIDPLTAYVGTESTLSEAAKEEIAEHWGLNDPPVTRFITWGKNVLQGDLGTSITFKQPVSTVILERFQYSIVLMMVAWIFSGVLGFIIGITDGFIYTFSSSHGCICASNFTAPISIISLSNSKFFSPGLSL